ncbi:hypothetical protein M3650_21045 [Paenibacillus sp. MER TA 81-3]|uniref:hypothetical protein n=1 Tax=Paenibacillus sp. MER TA 81-3 TaxID=2939573 RepID=UPI00203E0CA6|nr:hypothetical protein [Paenibacillus sp. MER TA 81-3]MCM3341051.1 hypothetical protein [Paenibacillus sp. MER TA 81-3]
MNRAIVSIDLSGAVEMKAGEQQSLQVIGIDGSGNRIRFRVLKFLWIDFVGKYTVECCVIER